MGRIQLVPRRWSILMIQSIKQSSIIAWEVAVGKLRDQGAVVLLYLFFPLGKIGYKRDIKMAFDHSSPTLATVTYPT